jgi:hypothetical protein
MDLRGFILNGGFACQGLFCFFIFYGGRLVVSYCESMVNFLSTESVDRFVDKFSNFYAITKILF